MKILISPGFGAGWSTWEHENKVTKRMMLTDPDLIAAIEVYGTDSAEAQGAKDRLFERIAALSADGGIPYGGGFEQLEVVDVELPFRIDEYDGSESVSSLDDDEDYWTE